MFFKIITFCAVLAIAKAGYLGAPAAVSYAAPAVAAYAAPASVTVHTPAITSQSSNILRSYGNLGQISTYSKSIDTPFSSVRKSDVRVSNPGYAVAAASPAVAYTAPAYQSLSYAAPAYHGVSYAAPAYHGVSYASPAYHGVSYAAPEYHGLSYGTPAVKYAAAAPAVASHGLLGVAYSPAAAVSHFSYAAPALGLTYGY